MPADFDNARIVQTQHRGHGPPPHRNGLLHQLGPSRNQPGGVGEIESLRDHEGGVLPKAVTGEDLGHRPSCLPPQPVKGHVRRQHDRLGHGRPGQIRVRARSRQFQKIFARGLRNRDKHRTEHGLVEEIREHARALRTLTGENHGRISHCRVLARLPIKMMKDTPVRHG
jgi:hypothetical protein